MTDNEEARWATRTHPYVAVLLIDPVTWAQFQGAFEDRPEVKIRKLDSSQPDQWTVYAACASVAVKDRFESNW
jgi:hypothetical protein